MGFMNHMVQTESSKVVSLNDSIHHSEERSARMELQNGSSAALAGQPKYKRRRVSAVRDFPPNCGRSLTLIGSSTDHNSASGNENTGSICNVSIRSSATVSEFSVEKAPKDLVERNSLGSVCEKLVSPSDHVDERLLLELRSVERPEAPKSSDQVDGLESVHVKAVKFPPGEGEPNGTVDASKHLQGMLALKPTKCDLVGIPLLKHETDEAFSVSRDSYHVDSAVQKEKTAPQGHSQTCSLRDGPMVLHISSLHKAVKKNYPLRRKVSCVRDFPPYCGSSAPSLGLEQTKEAIGTAEDRTSDSEEIIRKLDVKQKRLDIQEEGPQSSRDEAAAAASQSADIAQADTSSVAVKEQIKQDELETASQRSVQIIAGDTKEKNEDASIEDNISYGVDIKSVIVSVTGDENSAGSKQNLMKNIVDFSPPIYVERVSSDVSGSLDQLQNEDSDNLKSAKPIVLGLKARPNRPEKLGKKVQEPNISDSKVERKTVKNGFVKLPRPRSGETLNKNNGEASDRLCVERSSSFKRKTSGDRVLVASNKEESVACDVKPKNLDKARRPRKLTVSLPPSHPVCWSGKTTGNDKVRIRNSVKESLRLFQVLCRKCLQEEEAKSECSSKSRKRVDLQAFKVLKEKGKLVNVGKQIIGPVPGVEVGDEFQYRVELNVIGLHRQIQGGIDYVNDSGKVLCTSIVASGGYDDELDNADVLTYTGQGGNVMAGGKEPEDQKLERGNLSLVNSFHAQNPVRVIRGESKAADSESKGKTYTYDGLYLVEEYWEETGSHGKRVYKFRLRRIPGQPELAWKVLKKSKKSKFREGLCKLDISEGKERLPICAINTVDDEKPPEFIYTVRVIYPNWLRPPRPKGCDCTIRCSESRKCSCVVKNGGEIPYNHDGAIVEIKPLVYECGPACKCPPSCYNRVTQRGIKFQLEIFKTKSRGWGVRSLSSIPSGSFICEYAGELLEDKEAERRTGNDEYLFDIGYNYNDNSLQALLPESQSSSSKVGEESGFTIDAARYGNVGRFLNHSCSPNLYAQNVLYDHDDKRIPHVMFFTMDNIPPLQELTYDYNYAIDQVRDSYGNIKKKACYCGSVECTGRMY